MAEASKNTAASSSGPAPASKPDPGLIPKGIPVAGPKGDGKGKAGLSPEGIPVVGPKGKAGQEFHHLQADGTMKVIKKQVCPDHADSDDEWTFVKGEWPNFPMVSCKGNQCANERHWRKMHQKVAEMPEKRWTWTYTCAECCAREWGVDEGEAQARIYESRPGHDKRVQRQQRMNAAKEQLAEVMPLAKGKQIHQIARESLILVFAPLASVIIRKATALNRASDLLDEHKVLIEKLRASKSLKECISLVES